MDEATLTGTEVPEDWWRYLHTCEKLSHSHRKHLLALHVHCTINGEFRQEICTGFLLDIGTHIFWMTAGHVIDHLQELLEAPEVSNIKAAWMDHHMDPNATSMPMALASTPTYSAISQYGSDWGCIALSHMYRELIASNPQVEPLQPEVWKGVEGSKPAGFHLVGMAAEVVKHEVVGTRNGKRLWRSEVTTQCLPVVKLADPIPDTDPSFWDHPGDFFGQLTDFADIKIPIELNIKGMSGGPLFSIERDGESGIRYRLVGVQSAWLKTPRVIRATNIGTIADTIEEFLEASRVAKE